MFRRIMLLLAAVASDAPNSKTLVVCLTCAVCDCARKKASIKPSTDFPEAEIRRVRSDIILLGTSAAVRSATSAVLAESPKVQTLSKVSVPNNVLSYDAGRRFRPSSHMRP